MDEGWKENSIKLITRSNYSLGCAEFGLPKLMRCAQRQSPGDGVEQLPEVRGDRRQTSKHRLLQPHD